jgi:hypothetical protein
MPVPISSRAKKYLDGTPYYTELEGVPDSAWLARIPLAAEEHLIGVYQNTAHQIENSIVVTNTALHFFAADGLHSIRYNEIKEIEDASHDLQYLLAHPEARKLILTLQNGKRIEVPVTGSKGRGADMASFHSFLRGACQTAAIEHQSVGPDSHASL